MKKARKVVSLAMVSLFIAGQASASSDILSRTEHDKNTREGDSAPAAIQAQTVEPSNDPIPLSSVTTQAVFPSFRVGHDMERESDNDFFSTARYLDAMLLQLDSNNQFSLYGSVNDYDYRDHLKFQVPKSGDYRISLEKTTGDDRPDIRFYLKDASGTTIDGGSVTRMTQYLSANTTYYVYIEWRDATYNTSPYSVDFSLN